jgi:hypothetical protein
MNACVRGTSITSLTNYPQPKNRFSSFEVQTVDDRGTKRRFRASNYQVSTNEQEIDLRQSADSFAGHGASEAVHLHHATACRGRLESGSFVSQVAGFPGILSALQLILNLGEITQKAYGTQHAETSRVIIHANIRIRRVYFSDKVREDKDWYCQREA